MAQRPARNEVPLEQKWDLDGLYPTMADWEADVARVHELLPELAGFSGRLGAGAAELLACLRLRDEINLIGSRVAWLAHNRYSEDQGDSDRVALLDRVGQLEGAVQAAQAFIRPELLALPEAAVATWLAAEPGLAPYRLHLTDILAEQAHMLGTEGETVLAEISPLLQAPFDIWQQTTNVDVKFAPIQDEEGNEVPISPGAWITHLQSPVRAVRQAADESFRQGYAAHGRTLAAAVAAAQRRDATLARLRHYPSALAAALATEHMPAAVFENLVRVTEQGSVHYRRHLAYKRRVLGLDQLMSWDVRAPLTADSPASIAFADAFRMIREALTPLGPEYGAVLERAYRERWVDWADNEGKGGNAYSDGCYGYHPVVKIEWHGTLYDLFTLAHELGHAVHSWFTDNTQPYVYSQYSVSAAETASTTNEILLARHLLKTADDSAFRRAVLNMALTSFHDNFFYAGVLAALQLELHKAVETGAPLTYESITEMNMGILKRRYGDVVTITPDGMGSQWNGVLHHFRNFYGYQYALGISAAAAFADTILTEGAGAVERYLDFLRAGASAHPLELFKAAGLDMATPAPVERAVGVYVELIDELERL